MRCWTEGYNCGGEAALSKGLGGPHWRRGRKRSQELRKTRSCEARDLGISDAPYLIAAEVAQNPSETQ